MKKVFTLSLLIMILFVFWSKQAQRALLADVRRSLVVIKLVLVLDADIVQELQREQMI